jgi:hypothetical protein
MPTLISSPMPPKVLKYSKGENKKESYAEEVQERRIVPSRKAWPAREVDEADSILLWAFL